MPAARSMSRRADAETVDGARKARVFSPSCQKVTVCPCVNQRTPKAERMPARNSPGGTCSKRPLISPVSAELHTDPYPSARAKSARTEQMPSFSA